MTLPHPISFIHSMYHRLDNPSEKIPDAAREGYSLLFGEVCNFRDRWLNYEFLFCFSPERVDLLNKTASGFFSLTSDLLIDYLTLTASRLAEESKGQKNLTLEFLIDAAQIDRSSLIGQKLVANLDALRAVVKAIKAFRHKRIAHMDYGTAITDGKSLPQIINRDYKTALEHAERFLVDFDHHFTGVTGFPDTLTMWSGADSLCEALAKSRAYDALVKDGAVPRRQWEQFYPNTPHLE